MRILRISLLLPVVLGLAFSIASSQEYENNHNFEQLKPFVKSVLFWLPAETESLLYISKSAENAPKGENAIPSDTSGILSFIRGGKFARPVEKHKAMIEIVSSCHFRAPVGLNRYHYAGCHTIIFEHDLDKDSRKDLFKTFAVEADKVEDIKGFKVARFEEPSGLDSFTYFACLPKPNVLLIGTDEKYLTSMLDRIQRSCTSPVLEVGDDLWDQLDVKAPFWGIRLAGSVDKDKEQSSWPWKNDGGFVTFLEDDKPEPKLMIRNLLVYKNKSTKDIVQKWTTFPPKEFLPEIELISPKVVEIKCSLRKKNATCWYSLIIWRLGYEVNL